MTDRQSAFIPQDENLNHPTILHGDLTLELHDAFKEARKVAWDIETNGLHPQTALIGTCQIYAPGVGGCVVTGVAGEAPENLARLLCNEKVTKVFHHAPFDLSFMAHAWNAEAANVECTKVASKLLAPEAPHDHHSLQSLMFENFEIRLDKRIRFTDWISESLTDEQLNYAMGDVVRLLDLHRILSERLKEAGLSDLYAQCCKFLPTSAKLRIHGVADPFGY